MLQLIIHIDNVVELLIGQATRSFSILSQNEVYEICLILLNPFWDYPVKKFVAFTFGQLTVTLVSFHNLDGVNVSEILTVGQI